MGGLGLDRASPRGGRPTEVKTAQADMSRPRRSPLEASGEYRLCLPLFALILVPGERVLTECSDANPSASTQLLSRIIKVNNDSGVVRELLEANGYSSRGCKTHGVCKTHTHGAAQEAESFLNAIRGNGLRKMLE